MNQICFSKYAPLTQETKKQSASVLSSNSLVGDDYTFKYDLNSHVACVYNKFDEAVGALPEDVSRELSLYQNGGFCIKIFLHYMVYNQAKDCHYGEVAIVAYKQAYAEAFEKFCEKLKSRFAAGTNVDMNFGDLEGKQIISSKGGWQPKAKIGMPKAPKGCVVVKYKQTLLEKIIEVGRQRKPGCFVGSILFLVALIALFI